MSFQLFPPSPNWYSTRISTIAQDLDLFIYASRNVLFVMDTTNLQYVHSFVGHRDRVNAVSAQTSLCASASADRTVKCWDLVAKVLLEGHELHRNEVQSLTWLVDKNILVSGDKSGQIIVWDSATKKYHRSAILLSAVYCLAATISSGKDIVAIGYQNGSIVVAEVSLDMDAAVLYRLEAHEAEIHGLAWQPWFSVQDDTIDKESTYQFSLLASGSRDKTIRIWNVASETAIKTLTLPKAKNFWTEQQKSRLWLTVAWSVTNRNQLISSSHMGDMLLWNTRDAKAERFPDGHSRCIFNICVTGNGAKIITISMDRQIIMWDLRTRKPLLIVGTLGGVVHSLDVCDLDPRRVAMGLGDNTIRIWNYGGSAENFYDSIVLWKGMKGKVTCLKWHPSKEGVLAYGTDTGSIGLFDVHEDKNTAFKSYHKGKVYSIDWGPRVSVDAESQERIAWVVYSCGDGVVYASDPENPTKASVDVREAIERRNPVWVKALKERSSKMMKRSEVTVHPRGEYVAIGSADGSVEVHALPEYKLVYWFNGHRGCINRLKWCGGGDGTPSSLWLASGSEDGLVCVHDLGNTENFVSIELPIPTSTCLCSLKPHSKGVTDLGWKLSDSGVRLASTSYDGTAVIWDVPQGVPVARFRGHQGHVLSVVWSLLEDDLVFTGGDDSMLCVWRVGEWPYVKVTDSGKTMKAQAKKPVEPLSETISGEPVGDNLVATEPDHQVSLDLPTPVASLPSAPTASPATAKKLQQRSSKKIKSNIFPLSTASFLTEPRKNLQKQCLELAARFYGGDATMELEEMERAIEERERATEKKEKMKKEGISKGNGEGDSKGGGKEDGEGDDEGDGNEKKIVVEQADENVTTVGDLIFGGKVEVRKLIGMEVENHSSMGSSAATANFAYSFALPLDVWRSNLSGVIAQAMKSDGVDLQEWITLALSPSAGRDVWFNLMRRQAEKLAACGDYHTSAMCFLAISEVYDAVEVYRKAEMYREAIALIKLRLPPGDPILAELYTEWAVQCESKALFEQAAKCYLTAQTPTSIQHALNVLARRNDPSALHAAACLAKFLKDPSADERMARYEGEMKRRREWEEAMTEHRNALTAGSGDEARNEAVTQMQEVEGSKVTSERESEVGGGPENDGTDIAVHMDSDVSRVSEATVRDDGGDVEAVTESVVARAAGVESGPVPGNDTTLRCNELNDGDQ